MPECLCLLHHSTGSNIQQEEQEEKHILTGGDTLIKFLHHSVQTTPILMTVNYCFAIVYMQFSQL